MSDSCTTEEAALIYVYIVLWQAPGKEKKTINVTYALASKEYRV